MNQEYLRIQEQIHRAEAEAMAENAGFYRLGFHLMPPTGWLNDPNGLCQLGDTYHLFFQYAPLDARGGMKTWGHYTTTDFCRFTYLGVPLVPDMPFDRNGVYSGSAYTDEEGMHIYYTGNVKLSGEHDYVTSGRRADTIMVESKDGMHFGDKQVVISSDDYPQNYSCHIRDPKVWRENDTGYMVLGGRTKSDEGRILIYTSSDMKKWELLREITAKGALGYMWECPDLFFLDGHPVISFSPQGLKAEEFRYQNLYQSGYFISDVNPLTQDIAVDEALFMEWDMGFDFYAPQTFQDSSGRRILIGWAGMPDAEYKNGEVEKENWQHCFTVPRRLTLKQTEDGIKRVYQEPVEEIKKLRTGDSYKLKKEHAAFKEEYLDIEIERLPRVFKFTIADGVTFSYNGEWAALSLTEDTGLGRKIRRAKIFSINSIRILVDSSILEYYINDGEIVFTTRYYKKEKGTVIQTDFSGADVTVYPMERIVVKGD